MNDLSIFIYLAAVFETIRDLSFPVFFFGALICAGFVVGYFIAGDKDFVSLKGHREEKQAFFVTCLKNTLIGIGIYTLSYLFVPSKETMYLMLGSEVGEELILSEEAGKVRDIINQELDTLLDSYIDSEQETLDERDDTI